MNPRKIVYWGSTSLVALALLMSLSYLSGSEQVVAGFAKAGYPQHLRIVLGIVKPIAAIVLLMPGFALLKEWAYAGVTFALVMAFISAFLSGEGAGNVDPSARAPCPSGHLVRHSAPEPSSDGGSHRRGQFFRREAWSPASSQGALGGLSHREKLGESPTRSGAPKSSITG